MRLGELITAVQARPLSNNVDLNCQVRSAFASDLMSNVLCHDVAEGLLITGLTNPQMVRTAEMAEVAVVLMVEDKTPLPETLELAEELEIPILTTHFVMFETCGRLYEAGLFPARIADDVE
jgi:hypothetical protein